MVSSPSVAKPGGLAPSLSFRLIITHISGDESCESQRDSAPKPRVATPLFLGSGINTTVAQCEHLGWINGEGLPERAGELPWVHRVRTDLPQRGCVRGWRARPQPRWG